MAEEGVDLSSFTAEQQTAIQQFASVTNQSPEAALPLLQRCQWNVEIAITRFFDGEPATDPVAEAQSSIPAPRDPRRRETLINGSSSYPRSSTSRPRELEPAPRVVPQPGGHVTQRAPMLVSLLLAPFTLAYRLLTRTFGLLGYLFPVFPRLLSVIHARGSTAASSRTTGGRRPLSSRDNAARFIREFEEEYGENRLPFAETGYAAAFDAAKKDLKFLLVVLLSPEHDDTSSFVRDTLLSTSVTDFVRDPANNIVLWAGNVQDSEAYQVAAALGCTKFPWAGLIAHTPSVSATSMSIVARVVGPTPPAQFVARLRTAIEQNAEALSRARGARAEQQAARHLREEQNSAYERSLAADRERARQRREEEAAQQRVEQEARDREAVSEREARNLDRWRRWRARSLPAEPGPDANDVVAVSVRMLDGERVVRKFAAEAHIEELYAFVECYDVLREGDDTSEKRAEEPEGFVHEYKFQLVSPLPRTVYDLKAGGTLRKRIGRSGNLIVESTVADDEEENDDE